MAIQPDAKRPDVYTIYADQAGLGMPDRDYFLSDDAKFVAMRDKYHKYVVDLLALTGHKDATGAATKVVALETRLARAQWPNVDLRNVDKVYNPFDLAGAGKLTPAIDWPRYLEMMGVADHDSVIIGEPSYFKELSRAFGDVPLAVWRDYLRVRVVDDLAPYLNAAVVERSFDFNGRTITGTPQIRPRWKRALGEAEASIGDMLGKAYVARHYPPAAKARMDQLVANLLAAFASSIDELEWMGPETRRAAHAKLDSFTVKIGYPEKWKDYPGLVIRRDDLVGNVLRAREVNHRREVRKLGQPIDRTEWLMTPQTVNAYYNPLANEIVFPAAILQPPFFDMNADDAVNYGGIGAVIGHEISHGFDDQGRKFDGQGMLRDWWTEEDNGRFQARAGALASQYSAFSPIAGLNVNGELTLGENIGDLSGLAVAYKAYHLAQGGKHPAGDRRLHRRPALLHRLGPGLGAQVPRRRAAQAPAHRSAQPERVPLQRRGAQHAAVRRRVRRQARRRPVPPTRAAGTHLVNCRSTNHGHGEPHMRTLKVSLLAFGSLLLSACGYNTLQVQDEATKSAWAEVVNQYQRRADLIPNLVNTVKGYAAQEQAVLLGVTEARAKASQITVNADDPASLAAFQQAQGEVSSALSRLLVTVENYPDLKSDQNFRDLQAQLEGTENRITVARNRFIQTVQDFNVTVRKFPTNLTAMIFGYKVKPNFTVADEAAISKPPTVDFNTTPAPPPTVPEPAPTTEPAPAPST